MSDSRFNKARHIFGQVAGTALLATACTRYGYMTAAAPPMGAVLPEDPYAQDDAAMENRINAALQKEPNRRYTHAIVLNPDRVDLLIAQGLPEEDALRQALAEKGYRNPDARFLNDLLRHIEHRAGDDISQDTGGVHAVAQAEAKGYEGGVCVVVPAHENSVDQIFLRDLVHAGLSIPEALAFINGHEEEHCLDTLTDKEKLTTLENEIEEHCLKDNEGARLAGDPGSIDRLVQSNISETLADETILGKMVRGGKPVAMIGKVASVRAFLAGDAVHDTAGVLYTLEKEVTRMGAGAFRGLTDAEAGQLYADTLLRSGLSSPEAMRAYIVYSGGSAADKAALQKKTGATAWGIYAAKIARAAESKKLSTRSPAEEKQMNAVLRWDEAGALRAQALKTEGGTAPLQLLRAYIRLQAKFRAATAARPFDLSLPAQAGKLRGLVAAARNVSAPSGASTAKMCDAAKQHL